MAWIFAITKLKIGKRLYSTKDYPVRMGKMNKYNLKLLAVPAVIATIYLALSLCCTIISIIDTGEYDVCLFDPFRIGTTEYLLT